MPEIFQRDIPTVRAEFLKICRDPNSGDEELLACLEELIELMIDNQVELIMEDYFDTAESVTNTHGTEV